MGADFVSAPSADFVGKWWEDRGAPLGVSDAAARRAAGLPSKRAVIFECVGKPGLLKAIAEEAPAGSHFVVVGLCMSTDTFEPAYLIQKEITMRFVFAYAADEFAEAAIMIAANPTRLAPLVTGKEGLDGVTRAFDALERGGQQAKILIEPFR
jgi:threonine dehydrogenase-like Zn-dependent dehydrogenase